MNTPLTPLFFFKYEAGGNDFVLIEDYDESFPPSLTPKLCDRNFGIGADGVLLLQPSKIADHKMRIFNQDGSEASMCGNGLRSCMLHLGKPSTIETLAGLSIGEPGKATLPKAQILGPIQLTQTLTGYKVDTGTPHLVIFSDPDLSIVDKYRPYMNVNFATETSDGIRVRTFEKGVKTETLACGTGGAAAALLKYTGEKKIKILFPFSTLIFSMDSMRRLWMEGPARLVFQGNFYLKNPI